MRLLGICGSPRKGNTEWMLARVLESAREAGAETELVLLRQKDIKLCRGCLTCEVGRNRKPGECVIKDSATTGSVTTALLYNASGSPKTQITLRPDPAASRTMSATTL